MQARGLRPEACTRLVGPHRPLIKVADKGLEAAGRPRCCRGIERLNDAALLGRAAVLNGLAHTPAQVAQRRIAEPMVVELRCLGCVARERLWLGVRVDRRPLGLQRRCSARRRRVDIRALSKEPTCEARQDLGPKRLPRPSGALHQ